MTALLFLAGYLVLILLVAIATTDDPRGFLRWAWRSRCGLR